MEIFESDAYQAVLEAVEKAEGRMAPKKRLAVLAALDCFAEYGYDGTSTKLIAERAGIAEATIFRHFPSKRDLLLRIAAPVVRHILTPAASREAAELARQHAGEPRLILREVMLSRLHFMRVYEPLVKIVLQEILVNPDLRAIFEREVGGLFQQIAPIVAMFGPETELDRERFFRVLGGLLLGYHLQRTLVSPDHGWSDEEEVDFMVGLIFDGLNATT